jgi:hypothetical protein
MKLLPTTIISPWKNIRRYGKYLLLTTLMAGVLALGLKGWRVYLAAQQLRADAQLLETLISSSQGATDIAGAEALLGVLRRDIRALRDEAALFFPVIRHLDWAPTYGPDLAATEQLLGAADDLAAAAGESYKALAPLAPSLEQSPSLSPALLAPLASARPRIETARQAIARAERSWDALPIDRLSPALRARLRPLTPLLPVFDTAINLASAASDTGAALAPVLADRHAAQPPNVVLAEQLSAARPRLEDARLALARAAMSWERVSPDELPAPLRERWAQLPRLLPLARDGLDLALVLPELLGASGPRDYLLLAQNPYELRATGGFITAAGRLTLDRGRFADFQLRNSPYVDDMGAHPYPLAPQALDRYMGIQLWVFRDANWSPDFPTAARKAAELYQLGQARTFTSVVAFDPAAIQLLLGAIGPVDVKGATVSAANVSQYLRDGRDIQQDQDKLFIEQLGQAMIARIEASPQSADLLALGRALQRALDERHILLYVADPQAAALFGRLGWDGAVRAETGDFLMVVDSNVGYTKSNSSIQEQVIYSVDLSQLSAPLAELTVKHAHRVAGAGACIELQPIAEGQRYYEDLAARCYWDYLRVLAPGGSELVDWRTQPTPAEWMLSGIGDDGAVASSPGEGGTQTFSTFLVVPIGGQRETFLRYRLAAGALTHDQHGWQYRLRIQKQPGTGALPFIVRIRMPRGATVTATNPVPAATSVQTLTFTVDLAQDHVIDVHFQAP